MNGSAGNGEAAKMNAKQALNVPTSVPAREASATASSGGGSGGTGGTGGGTTPASSSGGPAPIRVSSLVAGQAASAAAAATAAAGSTTRGTTPTGSGGPGSNRGTRSPRPSPRPKKRRRSSNSPTPPVHTTVKNSDDEDDEEGSESLEAKDAFYLRHQNRALASELRAYKRQIDVLEAEREYRRSKCDEAREGVDKLGEVWAEVEGSVASALVGLDVPGASAAGSAAIKQEGGGGGAKQEAGQQNGSSGVASTGSGEGVETVPALVASLVRLASQPPPKPILSTNVGGGDVSSQPKQEEDGGKSGAAAMDVDVEDSAAAADEEEERRETEHAKADLTDLSRSAASIAARADALRSSLVPLLRAALASATATIDKLAAADPLLEPATLKRDLAALQNQLGEKESRLAELTFARDEAVQGERRVRRGLYRLASGRMKLSDVIKAVEMEDGSALFEEFSKEEATMATAVLSSPVAVAVAPPVTVSGADDGPVDSVEVGQLRKRLQDLEEVADSRENRISGLLMEREDYIKQINDLRLAKADTHSEPISVDDVKRSDLYTETATKLAKVEAHAAQLQKAFDDVNERWANTKGDLDLAQKTIKEMEETHIKRLEEISTTGIVPEKDGASDTADAQCNGDDAEKAYISHAKRVVELEHKLTQALENVRQAETVRESLAEANRINETISAKLDEYQAKNAALVQAKSAARAAELEAGSPAAAIKNPDNDKVIEKLQKEHRKMRKELSAALQSKDNSRAKQERAERERDALMKTNARLLAQSTEKDEMNARSLSTILHLNQLSEQLSQEKEILEHKAKAAEQLSLSARLAANAKERSAEEEAKDKEASEKEAAETKERIDTLISEKEDVNSKLTQSQAQVASIIKDLNVAKARCDELAKESTAAEEEKSRLMDSLAMAKKEAAEATKQAAHACAHMSSVGVGKGGVNSEFTMEQMETQVKVLKGRLACNVCNERDKQVILLRCRHMFCRPCVDKNIKNRSRKCPGCGQRFDMKDVGDVWL